MPPRYYGANATGMPRCGSVQGWDEPMALSPNFTDAIRLPSRRARARRCNSPEQRELAVKRLDLLKQMSFGSQIAEEEVSALAGYFVETNQWQKIANGEIDIVRGEKGAGKSAIYTLLTTRVDDFFDKGILLVAAENPRGATVFKDLVADPPTTEQEFIVLWKLYVLAIVARQMREFDIRGRHAENIFRALEDAKLLERELSLAGILRSVHAYAKQLIKLEAFETGMTIDPATQMPSGLVGRIVLKEPSSDLRAIGVVSIDELFADLDAALKSYKRSVWVLLDRLDVAFVENHALEANALRALIRAYADLRSRDQISFKIFLREDIWKRITEKGLREASHLTRFVRLEWTQSSLLNLIMRRLLNNDAFVKEFGINKEEVLNDAKQQDVLFYRCFPRQVDQGPQKAPTYKWLLTRCADGSEKTAPRELIQLLNCLLEQETKRLEQGGAPAPDDQLFDRSVFKLALPTVSDSRLNQFLYAEYAPLKRYVSKLERQKAEQTPESLANLWGMAETTDAIAKARELVEIGFFVEKGTTDAPTFWVPFLYRDALHLVQGKAESDDEPELKLPV
jgi:hypothetical protein